MTLLVGSIFHMTRKIVSEMTYNVSMETLNPTIPYHDCVGSDQKRLLHRHQLSNDCQLQQCQLQAVEMVSCYPAEQNCITIQSSTVWWQRYVCEQSNVNIQPEVISRHPVTDFCDAALELFDSSLCVIIMTIQTQLCIIHIHMKDQVPWPCRLLLSHRVQDKQTLAQHRALWHRTDYENYGWHAISIDLKTWKDLNRTMNCNWISINYSLHQLEHYYTKWC